MCLVYLLKLAKMRNLQEETARKCLCCSNGSDPFVLVFEHKSLINSLSEVLGYKVTREKYYPETLCYVCCCFINRVMEFRRLSQNRMNEFRAKAKLNGEEFIFNGVDKAKAATKLADSDATEVLVNGAKVDETPPKSKMFAQNENFKNAGFSGPIIASVQTGVSLSPIVHDEDEEEVRSTTTNSTHSMPNGDISLLTVAFERAESVIDTESGGNIDRQTQESAKASPIGFFTCPHCSKVYRKLVTLEKHVKKHVRKMAIQERQKRSREAPAKAMTAPECLDCGRTFDSKHDLRLHARVHKKRYDCDHCSKEFYNFNDYEWHQAVCDGERRAQNIENPSISGQRKTRSQLSTRLSMPSDEDDDEYSVRSMPAYSTKIQSINQWIQNGRPSQSEHLDTLDDDDRVSVVSGLTNITNLSDFSSCSAMAYGGGSTISIRTKYSSKSKSSVGDLMSARSSLSSRTLTRGISRKISKIDLELSFRGNGENLRGDRMQQRNKKLMRLRNREAKQLMKNGSTVYLCGGCIFSCDSLAVMMQHEKKKHNKLALYKCPECIERFTQEKYLNQHVLMHPSGPFYCIHCEEHFDTKFELKVHLDLHLEKSHSCQYCDLSFLKLSQMKQHILTAHLDRLNVHNGEVGVAAPPKTGIIDRVTFKKSDIPVVMEKETLYKSKSLVQKGGCEGSRRRRRNHYPYLEKLGNIDSKLVQMMRSGQVEVSGPAVMDKSVETASPSPVPVAFEKSTTVTTLSPNNALDDYEFQLPDEVDTDMNLEEHGIFSLDTIPDPDQASASATLLSDTAMQALLQSPPSDNTPCSSNGNTPPYASPNNSPTESAPTTPSKRPGVPRKRHRINVNSKRITKQIVQNNLKWSRNLESSVLPSYTEWWNASSGGGLGSSKKGRKPTSSNGPWR